MKKPTRQDYDIFKWLPIEQWSVDKLTGPRMPGQTFCKICDCYIGNIEINQHIAGHIKQRKKQITDDARKAKAARAEAMARAREEKRRLKAIENERI